MLMKQNVNSDVSKDSMGTCSTPQKRELLIWNSRLNFLRNRLLGQPIIVHNFPLCIKGLLYFCVRLLNTTTNHTFLNLQRFLHFAHAF